MPFSFVLPSLTQTGLLQAFLLYKSVQCLSLGPLFLCSWDPLVSSTSSPPSAHGHPHLCSHPCPGWMAPYKANFTFHFQLHFLNRFSESHKTACAAHRGVLGKRPISLCYFGPPQFDRIVFQEQNPGAQKKSVYEITMWSNCVKRCPPFPRKRRSCL